MGKRSGNSRGKGLQARRRTEFISFGRMSVLKTALGKCLKRPDGWFRRLLELDEKKKRKRLQPRRLGLETLEDRRVLSGNPYYYY